MARRSALSLRDLDFLVSIFRRTVNPVGVSVSGACAGSAFGTFVSFVAGCAVSGWTSHARRWIEVANRRHAESAECVAAAHLSTVFPHILRTHSLPDTSCVFIARSLRRTLTSFQMIRDVVITLGPAGDADRLGNHSAGSAPDEYDAGGLGGLGHWVVSEAFARAAGSPHRM